MPLSALYSGLSGLQAHASMLDVVGNNLANENTTAYKAQRVTFEDLVYNTLSAGTGPNGALGGTNPRQVGFGVRVGAIDSFFQQGPVNPTGRDLDLALQGRGFFVVNDGSRQIYTRDGSFAIDANGFLVDSANGFRVQRFGTLGEASGTQPGFQTPGNQAIRIPFDAILPGRATQNVGLAGNLSSTLNVGESVPLAMQIYDAQGTPRSLSIVIEKTGANTYSLSANITGGTVTVPPTAITFNPDGTLASPASLALTLNGLPSAQTVTLNLGTIGGTSGLTEFGGTSTAAAISQDGFEPGTLSSITVDADGIIQGAFSNGQTMALAQLSIANFSNQDGLLREGSNYFSATPASGVADIGAARSSGRGAIANRSLEGSNVDLALELSKLIIAQRGFQVNTRTIIAANEIEQDLTSIVR